MERKGWYGIAMALAVFTIIYNLAEGLFSMFFGYSDDSLALFGFGADSFIEVISGLGIAHMVVRIRRSPESSPDGFERRALMITGCCFYGLVVGLVIASGYYFFTAKRPETTFWGIVISVISIVAMTALIWGKTKTGRELGSDAILADGQCTKVCLYMSVILLISSGLYEWARVPYIDAAGTLGLAYLSFREGKECFEKVKNGTHCCSCSSCSQDIKIKV